jgi:hypothetical protein
MLFQRAESSPPRSVQRADLVPTTGYAVIVDGHFKTEFVEEKAAKKAATCVPSGGLAGRHSDPPSRRYRIDSDTPNVVALTAVAAGVRFSDLAMRTTPDFAFAIVFSVRTSCFVHARRRAVVFLRANTNLRCLVWRSGLLSTEWRNNK